MADQPTPLAELSDHHEFAPRHIGPSADDLARMLDVIGAATLDDLLDQTVPSAIRSSRPLDLPPARSEAEVLAELRRRAARNHVRTSLIGMGYSPTHTPAVIQRNVLEDPAWYTAYTPYQAEISQGRLEALLNFQTMVTELTGLAVTNASLLDEATAAAEAMAMARRLAKVPSSRFLVHHDTHPQTIAVLRTRAEPIGIDVVVGESTTSPAAASAPCSACPPPPGRSSTGAPPSSASTNRAAWRSSRPTSWRACSPPRRASWAPTSPSGRRSASACR